MPNYRTKNTAPHNTTKKAWYVRQPILTMDFHMPQTPHTPLGVWCCGVIQSVELIFQLLNQSIQWKVQYENF